jgi:hypothetical protein
MPSTTFTVYMSERDNPFAILPIPHQTKTST